MLGPDDVVCSHFTLTGAAGVDEPRFSLAERIAAAAAAGFAGIGIMGREEGLGRDPGLSDADLVRMLDDRGIEVAEIEAFFVEWSAGPDEPERVAAARQLEDEVWALSDALGPRVVGVVERGSVENLPPIDALVERFAGLCDRAAARGLLVALEFLPMYGIRDIAMAAEILRGANRPNAGLNVDAYHWFRGTPDADVLRSLGDRVYMVQLDDAGATVEGTLSEDTRRRRLPGDGDFDLVGFLRLMRDAGVAAPVSVEVLSPEIAALPVDEAARRAYESTRRVMDLAWR